MAFYGFRVLVVENTARLFGTGHVCHEDWERFLREKTYIQKSFCVHTTYTLLSPKRATLPAKRARVSHFLPHFSTFRLFAPISDSSHKNTTKHNLSSSAEQW